MIKQYILNFQTMTNIKIISWCYLLVLIKNINSNSIQSNVKISQQQQNYRSSSSFLFCLDQFLSFCNKTMNMSSPLSIIFTPNSLSYSSCCNITLIKPSKSSFSSSSSSEQIIINIMNLSEIIPSSFNIFNRQMKSIDLVNYSSFNRTFIKTDIIDLPLTFSLCQFNIQTFEILITNISKGKLRQINIYSVVFFLIK